MTIRLRVLILMLFAAISLLGACGQSQAPMGMAQEITLSVSITSEVPGVEVLPNPNAVEDRVVFTEVRTQNNCGNSRDLEDTIERSQTLIYTVEVGGGMTLHADGTVSGGLPAGVAQVEVNVGTEVAATYGVVYGREESLGNSLKLVTEAGKNWGTI
ncbi:MAG: hypothetical protein JXA14_21440 [Anaerolineae bacterium]|nr:hypothetical protein [Anaerolineae bacterium]